MARDAQLAGDRVQTEYYLQFADHYFRVLGESRSRFEEQRRSRDDEMDDEDGDEEMLDASDEQDERSDRADRQEQQNRSDRGDRQDRSERQDRGERSDRGERPERSARPERAEHPERSERPARRERPRYARDERDEDNEMGTETSDRANGSVGIADALPPAIGADNITPLAVEEQAAPRPRRRARPPRSPGDDEVAPAA